MHKRPTLTLRLVTGFATGILRCATALILFGAALSARAQAFEFVALGDLPYGDPAKVGAPYRALIDSINRVQPAFSIHVGDFKSGSTACSNEEFQTQLKHFGLFDAPLIYTPGDNEWTDCHRANNGAHDPLERLAALRSQFFPEGKSLGRLPLAVQSQAGLSPGHSKFVENLRWQHQRVLFATVHIVGSNNNFEVRDAKAVAEFIERDLANVAWIQAAFAQARQSGAQALVFAIHGDVFESRTVREDFPTHSGFRVSIGQTLLPLAAAAGIPVLLLHGDSHVFRFDQPFSLNRAPIANLFRLVVPGATDMRAVRVGVEPGSAQPWSVRLLQANR
ncbi:MAG: hypothetical protein WCK08_19890 [Betaproteobacteria bacterium]